MLQKKITYDYSLILPVCNEQEVIRDVVEELTNFINSFNLNAIIVVGVNNTSDDTVNILKELDATFGVTTNRGYGYGCQRAIDKLNEENITITEGHIFCAGDGANLPSDILKIIKIRQNTGYSFILGERTLNKQSWAIHGASRLLPNLLLGVWVSLLSGRLYLDLGPLRFIETNLFRKLALNEFVLGWTIEPQIKIAKLKIKHTVFSYYERKRIKGTQKISGVNIFQSIKIGLEIAKAGLRTFLLK